MTEEWQSNTTLLKCAMKAQVPDGQHVVKQMVLSSTTMLKALLKAITTDSVLEQLIRKARVLHWKHPEYMKLRIHLKCQPSLEDQRLLTLILNGFSWNGKDLNLMVEVLLQDTSLNEGIPTIKDGRFVPELMLKNLQERSEDWLRVLFMSSESRLSTKLVNLNHLILLYHTEPDQRTPFQELIGML